MLALLLSALPIVAAADLEVPENDGWVTDLGDMLSAGQEAELESLMESYKLGTGHDVALLTIPSLEGEPLATFALEVLREWGLGREDVNDGALLLVAQEERKIRIEVARGLEGNLTDSISGRIIRDVITPEFKAGDFYGGVKSGVLAVHAASGGDYAPIQRTRSGRNAGGALSGCFSMLFTIFLFSMIFGSRRRHGGGILPWLVIGSMAGAGRRGGFGGFSGGGGGGFSGFGGGGGGIGGGASGGW